MSNRSEPLDDRLEALGRIERRRLLLRLSTADPADGSRVDFAELACDGNGLDRKMDELSRDRGGLGRDRGGLDGDSRGLGGAMGGRNRSDLDPFVTLRHLHLPVLEERGFVRWDRENHRVTRGPRFEELEPFLELLRELQDDLPGRWV